jgi:hypothetical protein
MVDTGAKGHEGEDAFSYPHLRTHGITTLQLWVAWILKRVGSKVRTVSMATKKKRSVYVSLCQFTPRPENIERFGAPWLFC